MAAADVQGIFWVNGYSCWQCYTAGAPFARLMGAGLAETQLQGFLLVIIDHCCIAVGLPSEQGHLLGFGILLQPCWQPLLDLHMQPAGQVAMRCRACQSPPFWQRLRVPFDTSSRSWCAHQHTVSAEGRVKRASVL